MKNWLLKLLALTLAIAMVLSCMGVSAVASTDFDELKTIEIISTEDGTKYRTDPHAPQYTNSDNGINIIGVGGWDISVPNGLVWVSSLGGDVTVNIGYITDEVPGSNAAAWLVTETEKSKLVFSSEEIISDSPGIGIMNDGGTVIAKTGGITADTEGVFLSDYCIPENPNYSPSETGTSTLTVNGDVNVTGDFANGVSVLQRNKVINIVVVNGDITADAKANDGDANGVDVETRASGDITVTVSGNVTATSQEGDVTGIYADTAGGGDITVTAKDSTSAVAQDGDAVGICACITDGDGDVTINAGGNVTAEAAVGNTMGIFAESMGGGDIAVTVKGNITAESEDGGSTGIFSESMGGGDIAVTAVGNIQVSGDDAEGVRLDVYNYSDEKAGTVTAKITGGITVNGEDSAYGIDTYVSQEGSIEASVTGDMTVKADNAVGIFSDNKGGEIDVALKGNVKAEGTESGVGMNLIALPDGEEYSGTVTFNEDERYWDSSDDNLYRHEDGDTVIYYYADSDGNVYNAWTPAEKQTESTTRVEVIGDVTATETGAAICLENDETKMDIIVDGTLSGETQSVLVSENTIGENLTLTVWEIKKNDDGNVVERQTADGTTEADRDIEKNIQYIIKITPSQQDIISTTGTFEYEGYNVAREGETVTLKVEVPAGYQIKNAFSDSDQTIEMAQDDDGNYYLIVPKGGAVMISVEFEPIPEPEPQPQSADETVEETKAQIQPFVQTAKVAVMALAAETDGTKAFKELLENTDIMSILPDEIKELLPDGVSTVAAAITMTLDNYDESMGAVTLKISPNNKTYTKGEKATVVIALPDENGGYIYFYIEGEGQEDGTLSLNIPADTAKALAGKTFVTMILE